MRDPARHVVGDMVFKACISVEALFSATVIVADVSVLVIFEQVWHFIIVITASVDIRVSLLSEFVLSSSSKISMSLVSKE